MTPVKIIALFFVVFALVKILIVGINPSHWKAFVRKIYVKPVITIAVSLILGAVILRYLLEELTIVQIFASMTFMMALMMVQFALLGKDVMEIADKFLNDRSIFRKLWLSLVIWFALMGWVLYEIFV